MRIFYLFFPLFIFCNSSIKQFTSEMLTQEISIDSTTNNRYSWKENYTIENKLINRIALPKGYERIAVTKNSFGDWLRNLPLKPGNPNVKLYNGSLKNNQSAQFAVLDIDVGKKDLQQCADAVMRLRAEYLFSSNQKDKISFNFTSGDNCNYTDWKNGTRPIISGNNVRFQKTKSEDGSYQNFKNYLQTIFTYCGTYSLSKELKKTSLTNIKSGDVFIKGGFPGHAIIVIDVAKNTTTNDVVFLLAQSYMPAQDIHILKNPLDEGLSPWFSIKFGETLQTPEWNFNKTALKTF